MELTQQEKNMLLDSIREIKDFPQPGIVFRDITTLLNNKEAYSFLMDSLSRRYRDYHLDYVAGIESRGIHLWGGVGVFFGDWVCAYSQKGKLPYTTISEKYSLEYGLARLKSILMR